MAISENRNELELSNWFIVGIISISLLLGFLIGNSNSPVVGAAITAIAGLIGGYLSLRKNDDSKF